MKNMLIILVLAAVLAAVGYMVTEEWMRHSQNADSARLEKPLTGNRDRDMAESERGLGRAIEDLRVRQNYGMVGGGVGAGIGVVLGILLAIRRDRGKKAARP